MMNYGVKYSSYFQSLAYRLFDSQHSKVVGLENTLVKDLEDLNLNIGLKSFFSLLTGFLCLGSANSDITVRHVQSC